MDIFAVNTEGMNPNEHAYHTELPYGPGPGREWNPDFGYEPSDEDERRGELVGEDDDSDYNWGPAPNSRYVSEDQIGVPRYELRSDPYDDYDPYSMENMPEYEGASPSGGEHRIGAILR